MVLAIIEVVVAVIVVAVPIVVDAVHDDYPLLLDPFPRAERANTPHRDGRLHAVVRMAGDVAADGAERRRTVARLRTGVFMPCDGRPIDITCRSGMPEVIIDFIRTHHGTSKVGYFYNKQMNENGGQPVDEADFMYAGPRPYSRETAVVMLADSVEAAVKSLKVHNEETISNIIDKVIDAKIDDDQMSNCDITFRDIDKIKQLLKKRMVSIYHVRVEYPVVENKKTVINK